MTSAVQILTAVHVLISLIGLGAGFVVFGGFLSNRRLSGWTEVFLAATIATSLSGFLFSAQHLTPAHVLGVLSLLTLAVAVYASYQRQLAGRWQTAYVVSAVTAQFLNFFVLIVQLFLKVPALKALAPTQTEPVFAVVQLATLAAFLGFGVVAGLRSRQGSGAKQLTAKVVPHH